MYKKISATVLEYVQIFHTQGREFQNLFIDLEIPAFVPGQIQVQSRKFFYRKNLVWYFSVMNLSQNQILINLLFLFSLKKNIFQIILFFFSINRSSYESTVNTNGILFADTFIQSGDGENHDITPSLTEAILDPDSFLVSSSSFLSRQSLGDF